MKDPLQQIADLHVSVLVRSVGQGLAQRMMCRTCTREQYPCQTLKLVDRARQEQQ